MKSKATKLLIGILALVLCLLIVGIAVSGVLNPATVSGPAAMDVQQEETAPTTQPTQSAEKETSAETDRAENTTPVIKPSTGGNGVTVPTEPVKPAEPTAPSKPSEPIKPEEPAKPEAPKVKDPYDSMDEFAAGTLNGAVVATVQNQAGVVIGAINVGDTQSGITAQVPQGVSLEENVKALTLSVKAMDQGKAEITLDENQVADSLDVHMEGVAVTNTVPMLITLKNYLPMGLNNGNVQLYHVEQGKTLAMSRVEAPANHNEFAYDPLTGTVTLSMASFSEVAVVAEANNPWDGTVATGFAKGTGTEADPYLISTAHEMAYFRNQVDAGNTFEGKFVKLNNSISLGDVNFDPIGYGYECDKYMTDGMTFNGTFDGGNRTIFGLYQNGWELGDKYSYSMAGGGLFASVVDATIKNVKISGANIVMECVDMGILVGYSQGVCTYENIGIYNSKIANYQRATGGVVGEVSPRKNADGSLMEGKVSKHTFKNVNVGYDVTVGSLWGDFDAPCGGVLGARWDDFDVTEVVMEDVTVACRMDVYNDITAAYRWHAYRRAGMLIGNTDTPPADGRHAQTATADFLTCTRVTVHYGDWANYHYCEFTNEQNPGRNYPWVRVEEGENCNAYSNPRYGQPTDADGNKVTNSLHNHQEGDTCQELLPFAQLYGGGQGVYGANKHEGVTTSTPAYTITYMIGTEVDEMIYVINNSQAYALKDAGENMQWLNIQGEVTTQIAAGNTRNISVYLDDVDKLVAYFVDKDDNVIYSETFNKNQETLTNAPATPPAIEGYIGKWETYVLKEATESIVIRPIYTIDENYTVLDITAAELFNLLAKGETVVMGKDLTHTGSNLSGNTHNMCEVQEGKSARLNLNAFELICQFGHNANKSWHVFDIGVNASLTIANGIYSEGTLVMEIENIKSPVYVFVLNESGSALTLEKGVNIVVTYPASRANDVFAFTVGGNPLVEYPGLQIEKTVDGDVGTMRITATETITIQNSAS